MRKVQPLMGGARTFDRCHSSCLHTQLVRTLNQLAHLPCELPPCECFVYLSSAHCILHQQAPSCESTLAVVGAMAACASFISAATSAENVNSLAGEPSPSTAVAQLRIGHFAAKPVVEFEGAAASAASLADTEIQRDLVVTNSTKKDIRLVIDTIPAAFSVCHGFTPCVTSGAWELELPAGGEKVVGFKWEPCLSQPNSDDATAASMVAEDVRVRASLQVQVHGVKCPRLAVVLLGRCSVAAPGRRSRRLRRSSSRRGSGTSLRERIQQKATAAALIPADGSSRYVVQPCGACILVWIGH